MPEEERSLERDRLEFEKSIRGQRLDLDRDRLEFDRATAPTYVQRHLGAVITATATLVVVAVTSTLSFTQFRIADEAANRAQDLAKREHEQRWRVSLADFVTRNRQELLEGGGESPIRLMMYAIFPSDQMTRFDSKMTLVQTGIGNYMAAAGFGPGSGDFGDSGAVGGVIDIEPPPPRAAPTDDGDDDDNGDDDEIVFRELLAPLIIQFDRTKSAFDRWTSRNLYLETEIIGDGNRIARHLLMDKAELIPPDLIPDAIRLVEHYDAWLEKFNRVRGQATPEPDAAFVFVGPDGFPFPREAERRFRERYEQLQGELGPA